MQKTFGNFVEQDDTSLEYLKIRFSPTSVPLQQRWRNNGLSADFLADYWVTFFPAHDVASQQRQTEIRGCISYIANELLENMMKFNDPAVNYPVELSLYLHEDNFIFYATNAIVPASVEPFQARIQTLLTQDPVELYMQQVQKNMVAGAISGSGLGLLTMLQDYGAQLAWKFKTLSRPHCTVITTMVRLSV